MGEKWIEKKEDWCEDGFWCDEEFNSLHSTILADWEGGPINKALLPELETLIRQRETKYDLWGVKCHNLPILFHEFSCLCKTPVKVVFTSRPKEESIKSYSARYGIDFREGEAQMEVIYRALKSVSYEQSHTVGFHDLLKKPEEEIRKLADFVGVPVTEEALKRVRPELCRFRCI